MDEITLQTYSWELVWVICTYLGHIICQMHHPFKFIDFLERTHQSVHAALALIFVHPSYGESR